MHTENMLHEKKRDACRYCNRCMPCPAGISIGKTNKLLDQFLAGDDAAKIRYHALKRTAEHCFQCGACSRRCPFGVDNRQRMQLAREVM